jgi:AraC-like DNA-binding protein
MRINNLHKPFEITLLETDEYVEKEHKNTYFEMVFIMEGKGVQIINKHQLPYSPNKFFLIFPQDIHSFIIEETTRFFFLRFNESYLKTQPKEWLQKLEYIFHNHNHMPGCILKHVSDKAIVKSLAEALLQELHFKDLHQQEVIQQLLNTIITIAARNIALLQTARISQPTHRPLSLTGYVHQNIYYPENLRIEKFAEYFHVSPNYIGEYFKRETGEGLQQYINTYKMQMIEARLLHTKSRLNEIADEFGFTDTSHLNKVFRKHKGISPSEFRKRSKAPLAGSS